MILDLWRQEAGDLKTLRLPREISKEKQAVLQGLHVTGGSWTVRMNTELCNVLLGDRDVQLCNFVLKRTIHSLFFDCHNLLNLYFYLVLPHTHSYFKRLFSFTPAEKSCFLSSIPHCLAIQINLPRGIPECLFYLCLSRLCIGDRIIHTFDLE